MAGLADGDRHRGSYDSSYDVRGCSRTAARFRLVSSIPPVEPATIRLSLNQVGALAMTLPSLIDKALASTLRRSKPALCLSAGVMVGRAIDRSHPGHGHAADHRWFQRLLFDPAPATKRTRRSVGGAAGIEGDVACALTLAVNPPRAPARELEFRKPTTPHNQTHQREFRHGCNTGNFDHAPSLCGWLLQADADRRQMGRRRIRQEVRDA